MRLFDLHCDTLGLGYYSGESIAGNTGCVSLAEGAGLERWFQTFAAFIPEDADDPETVCFGLLDTAARWEQEAPGRFSVWRRSDRPSPTAACVALLSVENGGALAAAADPIDRLAARDVRLLSLTWNGDNDWASGCMGDADRGLTERGRAALQRMDALHILPDVSHLNERGFWQLLEETDQPVLATHSNAAAVCPHPRNLTDKQFQAIRERGGLVGLNLYAPHLGVTGETDFATAFAAHWQHFLELDGEQTVCLGSDLDGMPRPAVGGVAGLSGLYAQLQAMGYDRSLLDGLFFENARRFFAARWTQTQ